MINHYWFYLKTYGEIEILISFSIVSRDSRFIIQGHELALGVEDLFPFYFSVKFLMYMYVSTLYSFILTPRQCMMGVEMIPESN